MRDLGKGLTQEKLAWNHWLIEGYHCWTVRDGHETWVDISGVTTAANLTDARQWIRKQVGK